MFLLHLILDLAALLLWVNWRGMGFKEFVPYRSTLVHTLRSAELRPLGRWRYLAALGALLFLRGFIYQMIGPALQWVPTIDLGVLTVPFRSDQPWRMTLYSFLAFGILLIAFHLWLLIVSIVNRTIPDTQPVQHLVRLHLGPVEHWPAVLKLLLPILVVLLLWLPLHPLLVSAGLLPPASGFVLLLEQGLVLGFASMLYSKPLLLAALSLHLLNSYVHLGRSPLIDFASDTARNLLKLLSWLPLCWRRIDFAPIVLGVLIWLAARAWELVLSSLFRKLPL
jgi:hypothetical protein